MERPAQGVIGSSVTDVTRVMASGHGKTGETANCINVIVDIVKLCGYLRHRN